MGDGGDIVESEKRGYVVAGAFTPELALLHPDAVREMPRKFLHAGAEASRVMALYRSREKLAIVGRGDRAFEINPAATSIAKEVAGVNALVNWRVGVF